MKLENVLKVFLIFSLLIISNTQKENGLVDTIFEFMNTFRSDVQRKTDNFRFFEKSHSSPPNETSASNAKSNVTLEIVDLHDPSKQLSEWMTISSPTFMDKAKYPQIKTPKGVMSIDLNNYMRINNDYESTKNDGASSNFEFWFKVRAGYIYYSSNKNDINVLDAILIKSVENVKDNSYNLSSKKTESCFNAIDHTRNQFKLCSKSKDVKLIWMCSLMTYLAQVEDQVCEVFKKKSNEQNPEIKHHKMVQPVIIIPTAAKYCNQDWNYRSKGSDWNCECKEGTSQSPIDLPAKDAANLSPLKPIFEYENIDPVNSAPDPDYQALSVSYGVKYLNNGVRILHPNFGKIITEDGGVFVAEEINFHTPSEHTINGERFDMEMQIIHYGRSKGDIAKQIVLTFLFKKFPGSYNKFIDSIDFFNLPNPLEDFREIVNKLFIPNVFLNSDEEDFPTMRPFSFYTYEGSLTFPPCTARTTYYVAADPIPLSNTVIELFKEALTKPSLEREDGNFLVDTETPTENNREIQPLNGRVVTLFDHRKYGCGIDYVKKKPKEFTSHYEKRKVKATRYIWVNSPHPTGIPGSFVVSEKEAKGLL